MRPGWAKWFLCALCLTVACSAAPPQNLGVRGGQLAPCPDSPNCVSSQSNDTRHHVPPLTFTGSGEEALEELRALVVALPRTRLVRADSTYLHAEFRVPIFGFVDDVEFLVVPERHIIHVRSASRKGYWDLGVNRRRVAMVRERWSARQKQARAGTNR